MDSTCGAVISKAMADVNHLRNIFLELANDYRLDYTVQIFFLFYFLCEWQKSVPTHTIKDSRQRIWFSSSTPFLDVSLIFFPSSEMKKFYATFLLLHGSILLYQKSITSGNTITDVVKTATTMTHIFTIWRPNVPPFCRTALQPDYNAPPLK